MKTKFKFYLFSTFLLLILSCNKEDSNSYLPTKAALDNLFKLNLDYITQTATFNASNNDYVFTSAAGTVVRINGTCLRKNGNPVSGDVNLKFVEIFDRGTMAITNKSTMGYDANNELVALDSGGEILVKVFQDNVELTSTCSYRVDVLNSNTGGAKSGIEPWRGTIDSNNNLTWSRLPSSTNFQMTNSKYFCFLNEFEWFNYDRLLATGPSTNINVDLPSNYIDKSAVFLTTNGMPNSLGNINGKWRIGLNCNIIFLVEENGNFRYAIKPITVTDGIVITFNISDLSSTVSPTQMKEILNNLS